MLVPAGVVESPKLAIRGTEGDSDGSSQETNKPLENQGLGNLKLPGMDSNHEWLDQNQLCYHYTTGQYSRSTLN